MTTKQTNPIKKLKRAEFKNRRKNINTEIDKKEPFVDFRIQRNKNAICNKFFMLAVNGESVIAYFFNHLINSAAQLSRKRSIDEN